MNSDSFHSAAFGSGFFFELLGKMLDVWLTQDPGGSGGAR